MRIYMAGPLFSMAERIFNKVLAQELRAIGHGVWLPQENEPREGGPEGIFTADVEGIKWAEAVVACMDGSDPDSGTAWECGYAFATYKPVVCYRTDFRGGGDSDNINYNLMLSMSARARIQYPGKLYHELAGLIDKELIGCTIIS